MRKFNVERSREIRQWIGLTLSTVTTLVSFDIIFNNGKTTLKLFNKGKERKEQMNQAFNNIKSKFVKSKEQYFEEAKKEGYETLHYSDTKWLAVCNNYRIIKKTIDNDGYYRADWNDTTYYVMIG